MLASELIQLLKHAAQDRYSEGTLFNIAAKVLGVSKAAIYADANLEVEQRTLDRVLWNLKWGTPFAYIVGQEAFYGRYFYVLPGVFIPRNETELLVELAKAHKFRSILEFGTGSAALLISLLLENQNASGVAVETSYAARICTQANVQRYGLEERVSIEEDLPQCGIFDLIISNPPYVGHDELTHVDQVVLRFEPLQALFAPDIAGFYRRLINYAANHLAPGGRVILELNPVLKSEIHNLAIQNNFRIEIQQDWSGKPRVAILSS